MADLFLVACLYALMLGTGPTAAWWLGRRAQAEGAARRAKLRAALASDPCVLLDHHSGAAPLALWVVERGLPLRIRADVSPGTPPCWRVRLPACEPGAMPEFYLGVVPRDPRQMGWTLPRVPHLVPGLRVPGPRLELRSAESDAFSRLWCVPEVREALLHCFHGPAAGHWVWLDAAGDLEIALRLSFSIERLTILRARAAAVGHALSRAAASTGAPQRFAL